MRLALRPPPAWRRSALQRSQAACTSSLIYLISFTSTVIYKAAILALDIAIRQPAATPRVPCRRAHSAAAALAAHASRHTRNLANAYG